MCFLVILSSVFFIRPHQQIDLLDRLIMTNESDWESFNYRIKAFTIAKELFGASPLLGIGLGNYKIYINNKSEFLILDKTKRVLASQTNSDPHSIFSKTLAESGIIGIMALLAMIFFFLERDIFFIKRLTKNQNNLFWIIPYVISFWAYFAVILFTPSIILFRGGWFWFLRGVIEGYYDRSS